MPYGNPISVGLTGSSAGIEAGVLAARGFNNILHDSQRLNITPPWVIVGGAGTVAPVANSADMPVGGNIVYRITDTDAAVAIALSQTQAPGSADNRPLIFSFYVQLEAYVQSTARAVAHLDLLNGNTIDFTVNFNPSNGQIIGSTFATTEPGFTSAEASTFIQFFEGQNGVSAFRVNLIIFTRGLLGANAVTGCRLDIFPDVLDPTTVGGFIDVTAAQIAVPIGTITTGDFGLAPYVTTWSADLDASPAKIPQNALDVGLRAHALDVDPYVLDYYADLGTQQVVTAPGQVFTLPPIKADIPDGWWTLIGDPASSTFDISVGMGQTLQLGTGTPDVVGPATHTVLNTNVALWILIGGAASGIWQLYASAIPGASAGGGGGGGGSDPVPFVGTANVVVNHGTVGSTETTLTPLGVGSVVIPAGSLGVGSSFRLVGEGVFTTHPVTATGGFKYRIRSNGALLAESPPAGIFVTVPLGLTAAPFRTESDFTIITAGAGGTAMVKGTTITGSTDNASANTFKFGDSVATVPFDTTVAQTLDLTFQYGSAIGNLGTALTLTNFTLEQLTPGGGGGGGGGGGAMTILTPLALAGLSSAEFSGLPAGIKRIAINLVNVSANLGVDFRIRLGAPFLEVVGYHCISSRNTNATAPSVGADDTNFRVINAGSADNVTGTLWLNLVDEATNQWVATGLFQEFGGSRFLTTSGRITLPGALSRINISVFSGGGGLFDAGTFGITHQS